MKKLIPATGMGKPFHAFGDGRLSCTVEKFGGINSISYIDILERDGILYPDRTPTPLFSRRYNQSLGRALYGPAIRFLRRDKDGRIGPFYPREMEFFPWGFRSSSEAGDYSLLVDGDRILVDLTPEGSEARALIIAISECHLAASDAMGSMKNQIINPEDGSEFVWKEAAANGDDLTLDYPCRDRKYRLAWQPPDFRDNTLTFRWSCDFAGGAKDIVCAFTASRKMKHRAAKKAFILEVPIVASQRTTVGIALGAAPEQALDAARSGVKSSNAVWRRKTDRAASLANRAAWIDSRRMPIAEAFIRHAPGYQDAQTLAHTKDRLCIRAATDRFGYFAMWDQIYPIRGFLLNNRFDDAERLFRYMMRYPHVRLHAWVTTQLVLAYNEMRAFRENSTLTLEAWECFKGYYATLRRFVDGATGLVASPYSCGCDNMREFGIESMFYATCINGWWYGACRVLENMAREFNEAELADELCALAMKIDRHFMKTFYVAKEGYLKQADPARENVFSTTSTLGMDYPYGEHLFRSRLRELAHYQATRLYFPTGHVTVTCDSDVSCEMWKAVHMNQHLAHECRLARHAGLADEAYRTVNGYLAYFEQYRTAVETFNLAGCEGDEYQLANWQTFAAACAEQAIYRTCGIECHRGGIVYVPAADEGDVKVEKLTNNGRSFTLRIRGKGAFVKTYRLNGKCAKGVLQTPFDLLQKGGNTLEIVRSEVPFDRPTLYHAVDTAVTRVCSGSEELRFSVAGTFRSPITIYSPRRPTITHNRRTAPFEWRRPMAFLDISCRAGDEIAAIAR